MPRNPFTIKVFRTLLTFITLILLFVGYSLYLDFFFGRGYLPFGVSPKSEELIIDLDNESVMADLYKYQDKFYSSSSGSPNTSPADVKWSRNSDLFLSEVLSVDRFSRTLGLRILPPASSELGGDRSVSISCKVAESVLLDSELSPVQIGSRIWDDVNVGDTFFSYCLNEECTEVGKACLFGPAEER